MSARRELRRRGGGVLTAFRGRRSGKIGSIYFGKVVEFTKGEVNLVMGEREGVRRDVDEHYL